MQRTKVSRGRTTGTIPQVQKKKKESSPKSKSNTKLTTRRQIHTKKPPRTSTQTITPTTSQKHSKRSPSSLPLTRSRAFRPTRPKFDMVRDPLHQGELSSTVQGAASHLQKNRKLTTSARAEGQALTVLLAGFNSYFAQHLYRPLAHAGLDVIPVTNEPCARWSPVQTLHIKQIEEQGMPDVDFVINCTGSNIFLRGTEWNKQHIEHTRINSAQFWSEQIRKTRAKPYAFVQVSNALYYPSSHNQVYTNDWSLPPPPLPWQVKDPAYQSQELSLPYWSRLFRNIEHEARVWKPELDSRTPEQIAEYNQVYDQYFHDDKKTGVYGAMDSFTPEDRRNLSKRKDLLTNKDVRVLNFRHGHLLAKHMQEHAEILPAIDGGRMADIKGMENNIHPWIHVDDASALLIASLLDSNITGAINAVAPNHATSSELISYMTESRRSWKNKWFKINPSTVERTWGPVTGSIFLEPRNVALNNTLPKNFEFQYPDISTAINHGRLSYLDREVILFEGWENTPRNKGRNFEKDNTDRR